MITTIPKRILHDTARFFVPQSIDGYQEATGREIVVRSVHMQSDNRTVKTTNNTEVTLRGTLFVDARLSSPALDYWALQEQAHAAGTQMTVTVTNRQGRQTGPYTVQTIDRLPDDEGNTHHWELGLC